MFTVNLEKELIRQNSKIFLPQELLSIKEYERLGDDICNDEILNRVGLNRVALEGKERKTNIDIVNKKLSKFDQTRVFHVSQIESLCKKYHLRFLEANYFRGAIDKQLALKLSSFELAHDLRIDNYSCKIAAPAKSFALEERPKDPLFFYSLGNGYWYLIHKWGNDLSIVRRAYRILSNAWLTFFTVMIPLIYFAATNTHASKDGKDIYGIGLLFIVISGIYLIYSAVKAADREPIRFIKDNDWDSHYLG